MHRAKGRRADGQWQQSIFFLSLRRCPSRSPAVDSERSEQVIKTTASLAGTCLTVLFSRGGCGRKPCFPSQTHTPPWFDPAVMSSNKVHPNAGDDIPTLPNMVPDMRFAKRAAGKRAPNLLRRIIWRSPGVPHTWLRCPHVGPPLPTLPSLAAHTAGCWASEQHSLGNTAHTHTHTHTHTRT